MSEVIREIFTLDNLWHSLIPIGAVIIISSLFPTSPFIPATGFGIGLYIREAWQVDWDWTLRWSLHKHMEWIIGTVAGFCAAIVMEIV